MTETEAAISTEGADSAPDGGSELETPTQETADYSTHDQERTANSDDIANSLGVNIDRDSLPPELQEHLDKIEKDFKSGYTRRTQEYSAREKAWQQQYNELSSKLEQTNQVLNQVLSDPAKYQAYQTLHAQPGQKTEVPEFETVNDLVGYLQGTITEMQTTMEQKIQDEVTRRIGTYDTKARWEKTVETKKASDPTYAKYSALVENEIFRNPERYKPMYTGNNEGQILDAALKNVLAFIQPSIEEAKFKSAQALEKKKKASTFAPTGGMAGAKASTTGGSKDDIISRINKQLGPNPDIPKF